jgi:hypothetical protein
VRITRIRPLRRGSWRLLTLQERSLIGAAPKNYLAFGDPDNPATVGYIAKKAKNWGPRECLTEEIISKIGHTLPVRVAHSRLVRLPAEQGRYDEVRFLSEDFIRPGEALVHGAELMARYLEVSPDELHATFNLDDPVQERRFYSVDNVIVVLKGAARTDAERRLLVDGFGRMIAFDALVGAPDRHALNWGIVEVTTKPAEQWRFAPLFDTARGLFGDHKDHHLDEKASGGKEAEYIKKYAEKSRPVFSCSARPGGHNANHFDLVAYCLESYDMDIGRPIRHMVRTFSVRRIEKMLRSTFGRLLSPMRRRLIVGLLHYRHLRLKAIIETNEVERKS